MCVATTELEASHEIKRFGSGDEDQAVGSIQFRCDHFGNSIVAAKEFLKILAFSLMSSHLVF